MLRPGKAPCQVSEQPAEPCSFRFSPRLPEPSILSPLAGEGGDGGEKHDRGTPPACTPTLDGEGEGGGAEHQP
jgi:hypothetical protein